MRETAAEFKQVIDETIAQAMRTGAQVALNTLIVDGAISDPDRVDEFNRRIKAWQPKQSDRRIPA